jgi:hypothetical protein
MNISHTHSHQSRTLKYVHIWRVVIRDFYIFNKNRRVRVPEIYLNLYKLLNKLHMPIHLHYAEVSSAEK